MRIRRFLQLGAALIVSVSALLTINVAGAFAAAECTWVGGSAGSGNENFSTAANWTNCGGGTPATGDDLIFDSTGLSGSDLHPVNDMNNPVFGNITFEGSGGDGFDLGGDPLTVTGSIDNQAWTNEISLDVTLQSGSGIITQGGILQFGPSSALNLGANSINIDAQGFTVFSSVVSGSGSLNIGGSGSASFYADNTFTGTVTASSNVELYAGSANVFADASSVTISGTVKGTGNMGDGLTIDSGGTVEPGDSSTADCLNAGDLTLNGTYDVLLGGSTACTDYDQIDASGSVDVTGGALSISLASGFVPTVGQTFEIVDNAGSSPVTGTFTDSGEGATFPVGGYTFKISYVGGDGNDIVLTALTGSSAPGSSGGGSSSGSGSSSSSPTPGTPDTGLALVAAHPLSSLAASLLAAFSLVVIARRLKPIKR